MPYFYLSYSHRDKEFVYWLADTLVAAGIDVWIDKRDLLPGEEWLPTIQKAIVSAAGVIVCLTATSLQSHYVGLDIAQALDHAIPIIPLGPYGWPGYLPDSIAHLNVTLFGDQAWEQTIAKIFKSAERIGGTTLPPFTPTNPPPGLEPEPPIVEATPPAACVRPIKIFVSSPGDLANERRMVQTAIRNLDRSRRYMDKFKLIDFLYEDRASAQVGKNAQVVVNETSIESAEADIVICMLWSRMGTPTTDPNTGKLYQSGTEYELITAYETFRKVGKPYILLFRCTKATPSNIDTAQLQLVQEFFKRFDKVKGGDLEGLFFQFKSTKDFEVLVRRQLEETLDREFD